MLKFILSICLLGAVSSYAADKSKSPVLSVYPATLVPEYERAPTFGPVTGTLITQSSLTTPTQTHSPCEKLGGVIVMFVAQPYEWVCIKNPVRIHY